VRLRSWLLRRYSRRQVGTALRSWSLLYHTSIARSDATVTRVTRRGGDLQQLCEQGGYRHWPVSLVAGTIPRWRLGCDGHPRAPQHLGLPQRSEALV